MQNGFATEDAIRLEIKKLVASITEREPEEISDTALFTTELGIDSLMAMEIMVAMDKKFHINIPEEDFIQATNVDQAVLMVSRYLNAVAQSAAIA